MDTMDQFAISETAVPQRKVGRRIFQKLFKMLGLKKAVVPLPGRVAGAIIAARREIHSCHR